MNKKQSYIVWGGIIVFVLMGLPHDQRPDPVVSLVVWGLIVVVVGGALWYLAKDKPS